MTTPKDLLELWKAGRNVPDVYGFYPTEDEPVKTVRIGEIDGQPVNAYGVREDDWCMNLSIFSSAYVSIWTWYLDRDKALDDANFRIYDRRYGREWANALAPESPGYDDVYRALVVTPLVGAPFNVNRVLMRGGFEYGWVLLQDARVCRVLHETLHRLYPPESIPDLVYDDILEVEVPPIREDAFVFCPHCKQDVVRYLDGNGRWHLDRRTAQKEHDEIVGHISALKNKRRIEDEKRAFEDFSEPIWQEADRLRSTRRFRVFGQVLGSFGGFEGLWKKAAFPRNHDRSTFVELEKATRLVAGTMDAEEARILDEVNKHNLIGRVETLLGKFTPNCPVCQTPYVLDAAWFKYLLVLSSNEPTCAVCAKTRSFDRKVWSEPFAEIVSLSDRQMPAIDVVGERGDEVMYETPSSWIETIRVEADGKVVVRFVFDPNRGRYLLVVDRAALIATATSDAYSVYIWAQTRALVYDQWAVDLEAAVLKKDALKLNLRYDARRQSWGDCLRKGGKRTVYAVHRENEHEMEGDGLYYCEESPRQPKSASRPGFELVLVRPILKAPTRRR